jgi:hypothetical protein
MPNMEVNSLRWMRHNGGSLWEFCASPKDQSGFNYLAEYEVANEDRWTFWREITGYSFDSHTGKFTFDLKPMAPSLRDAWAAFKAQFPHITSDLEVSRNLESAISRELNRPSAFG